jgi:hypothetical protein
MMALPSGTVRRCGDNGPGGANLSIRGDRERQVRGLIDPDRLQLNGVTLNQIIRTAGKTLEVLPRVNTLVWA